MLKHIGPGIPRTFLPPGHHRLCSCLSPKISSSMYRWTRLGSASRNRAFDRTLLFLFTIHVCRGVLVNRTIDNTFGDPVTGFVPIYQPQSNLWSNICSPGCDIEPDTAKAFDGTYDWALYTGGEPGVNVTLQFTGVAIWVFFILSNFNNVVYAANTHVNITLDGRHAGTFSHDTDSNGQDLIYNATVFSTSGLTNASHELVIGTNSYPNISYLNFDWAIYSVDLEASVSQNPSSSTSVAFPSTTSSSSTSSTTPSSSPKIGVIVGCTLGGLAVITLILVFLVRRLRRAPPVQNGNAERVLDIDVPPRHQVHQPFNKREIPVSDHVPIQSKAARLREARQRALDGHIQSARHELDNLRSLRNARSAHETDDPSVAGPSQPSPELALLLNEMQQLRNRVGYLQAQRESDWALGLSDEPLPPAYTQLSNNPQ